MLDEFLKSQLGININLHIKYYIENYASTKCSIYPWGQEDKNEGNQKEAIYEKNSIISNSPLEYHWTYINA